MKSQFLASALLALSLSGCVGKHVTPETPKAAAALRADSVVIRINELQAVVIDACGPAAECQPGSLSTALARTIVRVCIDVRTAARSVPDGWQASVRAAWAQARPKFAGVTNPAILAALSAVDTVVGSL